MHRSESLHGQTYSIIYFLSNQIIHKTSLYYKKYNNRVEQKNRTVT